MAFHTAVNNALMIENSDVPSHTCVTRSAVVVGANVVKWFAGSLLPVMATLARLARIGMIKPRNRPS